MSKPTLFVLLATARAAAADPTAGAQAEALFDHGRQMMAKHELAEACASFDASERLEPATTTLVNLADCREQNEQLATAWGLYLQAERELRAFTDDAGVKVRDLVKTRAAALEPRLSKLTVRVADASRIGGLEILRGNDRVDAAAWNQPMPVDGGAVKISARAPDRREWTTTVIVKPSGDAQVVDIPALVATPTAPPPAELEVSPSRPTRMLPIGFGAGAVALAGASLGFELWGRGAYADAKTARDAASQQALVDSANTRRHLAIGTGVAALASAGAAVYFYLHDRGGETEKLAKRPVLVPAVSAQTAGLSVITRW